jgi:hypothetical protein
MSNPIKGKPCIWKIAAAAVGLLMSLPVHAQDDYLSSIEAEAENTQVLEKAIAEQEKLQKLTSAAPAKTQAKPKQASKPAPKKTASAPKNSAKTNAGQKKFESELFAEFPGNFAVYSSLNDSQKGEVYKAYADASDKEGLMRFGPVLGKILDMASQ